MIKITITDVEDNVTTYTGVIACSVGHSAIQMLFYGDVPPKKYIPISRIKEIDEVPVTDKEILEGDDKEFAAWYQAQIDAYKQRQAEAEAQADDGNSDKSVH